MSPRVLSCLFLCLCLIVLCTQPGQAAPESRAATLEHPLPCRPSERQPPACRVRIQSQELRTLATSDTGEQPLGGYTLPREARAVWVHESLILVTLTPSGLVVLSAANPVRLQAVLEIELADIIGLLVDAPRQLIRLRLASGEWREVSLPPPPPPSSMENAEPARTSTPPSASPTPSGVATGSAPEAKPAAGPNNPPDYRTEGRALRIFSSSAPDARELGSARFAQDIRKLVSFQGLLAVSFAPTGLAILDARVPQSVTVLRFLSELDVRQLEIEGAILHYATAEGERNEFYLPKLLQAGRVTKPNAYTPPGFETRCPAATANEPAGQMQVRIESSLLIIREQRKEGPCWHGTLRLPSPAQAIMSHRSAVYIAAKDGDLLVVDVAQPAQPKLVQSHNTFCILKQLALSSAKDELLATTDSKKELRFALTNPLAPKLLSQDVVASCRAALNQLAMSMTAREASDPSHSKAPESRRPGVSRTTLGKVLFGVGLGVFALSYVPNILIAAGGNQPGFLVPGAPFLMAGTVFSFAGSAFNNRCQDELCRFGSGLGGVFAVLGGVLIGVWGVVQVASLGVSVAGIHQWATAAGAQSRPRSSVSLVPSAGLGTAGIVLMGRY